MPETNDFRIGNLRFDPSTGDLSGCAGARRLEPRAAAVLATLVRASGDVIPRHELLARCWAEGSGSDEALTQAVAQVRRILAALGEPPDRIVTLAKRGYRITLQAPPSAAPAPLPRSAEPVRAGPAALPARHAALALATLAAVALVGWAAVSGAPDQAIRHDAHAQLHATSSAGVAARHGHDHASAAEPHAAHGEAGE